MEGTEDLEDVGCPKSPDQGRVMGEEHCWVGSGDSTCSPDSSLLPTLLSLEDVETDDLRLLPQSKAWGGGKNPDYSPGQESTDCIATQSRES